jgi:hypothetical protein
MLPPPFQNNQEILAALRQSKKLYKSIYSPGFKASKFLIIKNSVSGNTFRSSGFVGGEYKPSSIYRTWAQDFIFSSNHFYTRIVNINASEEYGGLHRELKNHLASYWRRKALVGLQGCYYYKLVDLLMKSFINYNGLTKWQEQRLLQLIHVPLDSYTLNAIRILWNQTYPYPQIPNAPSMAFIGNNYNLYNQIQHFISNHIGNNNPIQFDVAVWNRPVTDELRFQLEAS